MRNSPKMIAMLMASAMLAVLPSNATGQFNNPPTTSPNSITLWTCQEKTVNVTSNDSDPEGNYPLTVTSVESSYLGFLDVASASSVTFWSTDYPGSDAVSYTVEDSLGASSTGTIYLTVNSRVCP